ncbi:hypothetical protein [Microcoleus sp. herbarium12]|uniref:hypothetical protein n=1 Tax=Microcoleus sp. herbarium12 TaxID=3055437 RepID=UPI002FD38973
MGTALESFQVWEYRWRASIVSTSGKNYLKSLLMVLSRRPADLVCGASDFQSVGLAARLFVARAI